MLKRKIPAVYMIVAAVLGCALSVVAVEYFNPGTRKDSKAASANIDMSAGRSEYNFSRLEGYKYIQPLYLAEPKYESGYFTRLKGLIDDYVKKSTQKGEIENASVYIKDFSNDDWMVYNATEVYHPGSLFKVITMISLFRMAENSASLLQKEIIYPKTVSPAPQQTFESKRIVPGEKYTVKDLIYRMIVHSDNDATMLLHQHVDKDVFTKVFSDLGLKKPIEVPDVNYELTVKEYSRFVSVLYEGGYLSLPASEAAISLLCESDFSKGITSQLPAGLMVAHKFGEAGSTNKMQLHESGIVYLNDQPYLITIMTKGKESVKLAKAMGDLSKMAYDEMAKRPM